MKIYLLILILSPALLSAQFDPPAGQAGSLAIPHNSPLFVAWATGCTAQRGLQDIANPSLGTVTTGSENDALGMALEGGTLSLGDGGEAVLSFSQPIRNGVGADFAVFENAFQATFLELAFVEVSSDGQHFVRFPAISNTPIEQQVGSFGSVDATHLYNLAGKYSAGYGTPFDLEELRDSFSINIENITHIKLIDVVGSIQPEYARRDSRGAIINEPFPTPFPQGGFDLDAVGVIHQKPLAVDNWATIEEITLYPNPLPAGGFLHIKTSKIIKTIHIYSINNQFIKTITNPQSPIQLAELPEGLYWLEMEGADGSRIAKSLVILP